MSLDVSAFDPVGVNQNKLRFLEAFAAFCALRESQPIETAEQAELDGNHAIVAKEGRRPGLKLRQDGRDSCLRGWALEIVDCMRGICELLDGSDPQRPYCTALAVQQAKITDRELTPAARMLTSSRATASRSSIWRCACRSCTGPISSSCISPNESRQLEFAQEAEASLAEQARVEASGPPELRRIPGAVLRQLTRSRPAGSAHGSFEGGRTVCKHFVIEME